MYDIHFEFKYFDNVGDYFNLSLKRLSVNNIMSVTFIHTPYTENSELINTHENDTKSVKHFTQSI
jgi:hypothetical protein